MDEWQGMTVGEVLAQCKVDYQDLKLLDDPPGKLRGIEFTYYHDKEPVNVVLEFAFEQALFSLERSWSKSLVESQRVSHVHMSTEGLR